MVILDAAGISIPDRLQATDLKLSAGQSVALIGPNGGGKTSLIRALAGIDGTAGGVRICGHQLKTMVVADKARSLYALPASRHLDWPIRVADYLRLSPVRVDEDHVASLIEALDLGEFEQRAITDLSTGERARIMLARAFANDPKLLLLDEPLANLDPYWVLQALRLIDRQKTDKAILVALHDLSHLHRFDRVLLIDHGRLCADGTAETVTQSPAFEQAFRIRWDEDGWREA